jgi:hypothetical protein
MWLLPLVPVLAGTVAVLVAVRSDGAERSAIDIDSSAADVSTVDDLVAASDRVVVATVADITDGRQISAPADPDAAVVTRPLVLDVSVALAGSSSDDVIVEEPAALADGTPVVVDGVEPLDVGDEAVWFLVGSDAETMPYFALVNRQGRYTVAGDSLQPASDDPLSRRLAAVGLDGLSDRIASVVLEISPATFGSLVTDSR